MLVWVRKLMGSWVARIFFSLLVIGFVFWGISNVQTLVGNDSSLARVGGTAIDISTVQAAYQAALNQAGQQGQPDLATRQQLASQALADALRKQIIKQEEQQLGVVVPDAAVRQMLDQEPAFQTNGVFDKTKFEQLLAQNNSSPDQFLGQVRDDIASRQLLVPLLGGVTPPADLLNRLFAYVGEQRTAQTVAVANAAQPAPPAPTDDVLQHYWRNHPAQFTSPEYRHVQIVILSPALLAPQEQVAQADIDAAVARAAAAGAPSVAQRSVQVLTVGDLASSSRLEAAWKKGASWDKMQALAKQYGASAIELDQAAQTQIPSAALGQAVFAADIGKVVGPVAGDSGMYVFKVTASGQSGPDKTALQAQATQALQLQKAQADVATYVDQLQDALAGQTPLDQLPGNLGLVAVQGTLDANGNTPEGGPAPIPGGDALKAAILKAAFAAQPGDPPQLINGPDGSYFALSLQKIEPPALQDFAQVHDKVLAAWTQDQQARAAEIQATALYRAVQQGQSLSDVAKAAGLQVTSTGPLLRSSPQQTGDVQALSDVLFSMKQGQATMVQTSTGFTVAQLTQITAPNPAQYQSVYQQWQQQMTKDLQNDLAESFLAGLQARDKVIVNQKLLAQIYQ
jgi:peptidyl-prolyl cis-trans isomerase D